MTIVNLQLILLSPKKNIASRIDLFLSQRFWHFLLTLSDAVFPINYLQLSNHKKVSSKLVISTSSQVSSVSKVITRLPEAITQSAFQLNRFPNEFFRSRPPYLSSNFHITSINYPLSIRDSFDELRFVIPNDIFQNICACLSKSEPNRIRIKTCRYTITLRFRFCSNWSGSNRWRLANPGTPEN